MIDYEKLMEHLNEEIDYHKRQCDSITWINSPRYNQWLGGYDALLGIKEFLQELANERPQELTQSERQLKDAWYFDGGIEVTKVKAGKFFECCDETNVRAFGRIMYNSRELLIEDNLKTWSKLYEETHPGFLCLIQEVKPYKSSTDTPTPGAWI